MCTCICRDVSWCLLKILCVISIDVISFIFIQATDSFKTSNFQQIHSELTEVEINPDEIELVLFTLFTSSLWSTWFTPCICG